MQSKNIYVSHSPVADLASTFEQLLRTDLKHQNLKSTLETYDRVEQEIAEAEEELNKTKIGKRRKALNQTINNKKKWIKTADKVVNKNHLSLWAMMFQGYQIDLVVKNEHIRKQGLTVKKANEELVKLLQIVLQQDINIEGKTYSASEIKEFKTIINRFHESIKTIVIENKSEITLEKITKLLSGADLTIEHQCIDHAVYTQIYQEENQLVITHCNRGNGQRANYNLVYRMNIIGLDLNKLRTAIETITGLEVVRENEGNYKNFYDHYDKTLKTLGFSLILGKHVKSQKIGNCTLANVKGLLKERLPDAVYKWCTSEMRDLSNFRYLINPMLESGKNLKNKQYNIDKDDDFFHLRQLINYIFDKSIEGLVNDYSNNYRKSQAIKKAFKAIGDYEKIINDNKALSRKNRFDIKNYIHLRLDIYKKLVHSQQMRKLELFYRVLGNEAQKIAASSFNDPSAIEFLKYSISKAARHPSFFNEIYNYFCNEKKEYSNALKLVLTHALEVVTDDSILNDPEYTTVYQSSLRRILLKECEKIPVDQELVSLLAKSHLTNINPSVYLSVSDAMKECKNDVNKYATLKLLLNSSLRNNEFLDLFAKKKPQATTFFKPKKEHFDLCTFFKAVAKFIIDNTERPLTQEKLQRHLGQIGYAIERTVYKDKVLKFLELFCYKQLIDSKKINPQNIRCWNNTPNLAHQCKQISYCFPHALNIANSVLDDYKKLNTLFTPLKPKQRMLFTT